MLSLMFLIINGYLIKCFVAPTICIVFIVFLFEKIESLIELLMIKKAIIVNINEAYSTVRNVNRKNNVIATLKSDEIINYIINDEKNQLEFQSLY